ncbi:MAG: hypothetical protein V4708_06225, partial [Bacteroidota bacterium]
RLVWDQEVVGSNPATPTNESPSAKAEGLYCFAQSLSLQGLKGRSRTTKPASRHEKRRLEL